MLLAARAISRSLIISHQISSMRSYGKRNTLVAAATAAAYCSSSCSHHATAFVVSPASSRSFVAVSQMQMTTRLYQSMSPPAAEPALEEQQDEATLAAAAAAAVPLLLAHGEVVNVRSGGVAAIRLETETMAMPTTPSASAPVSTDNVISSSAPAIKAATKKQKQNKPSQGDDYVGKTVIFGNGEQTGVVVAQRPPVAFVLLDGKDSSVSVDVGSPVKLMSTWKTLRVTDAMIGQVLDYNGNPMTIHEDGTTAIKETTNTGVGVEVGVKVGTMRERAMFASISKVDEIALIDEPLLTGQTMVDALAPLGKGQNMLVVGHEGMEAQKQLVVDSMVAQVKMSPNVRCVYALTTSDRSERALAMKRLKEAGILDDIIVLSLRDNDDSVGAVPVTEAIAVAAAACAIGEAFALEDGGDSYVVVDTVNPHKTFWDETTRTLLDLYGMEAVVKDDREGGASSEMRAFYSGLIQRAGRFNKQRGGGSVTLTLLTELPSTDNLVEDERVFQAEEFDGTSDKVKARIAILLKSKIPLTATNLKKIQIPVPVASESSNKYKLAIQHTHDLMSMSDGQIWLEPMLEGVCHPPMDPQRSITRIGIGADITSRADAPAMRSLTGGLRFELSQALDSTNSGDANGQLQVCRRNAWLLAMDQEPGQLRSLAQECVLLLAAKLGVLDASIRSGATARTPAGRAVTDNLLSHVVQTVPQAVLDEIDTSLDLSPATRLELETSIRSFFATA
eukprot:scaffold26327_cov44-Attheya_sp.AAC.1